MTKFVFLFTTIALLSFSCKKKDNAQDEVPTQVAFEYSGENVTYGVVKKVYTRDSKGDKLASPVTKFWLDRNLGAKRAAINMNDSLAGGDLFQWGRKADGHQRRDSQTSNTLASSANPQSDKFILGHLGGGDWLQPSDNSLWNGSENKNCDCPQGWRFPTVEELEMEMHSWDTLSLSSAFNSPLKWSGTGERDGNGSLYYSYYWAFIWSSTPTADSTKANALQIIGSTAVQIGGTPKSLGHAVRCIRD